MSFSQEVKQELSEITDLSDCCTLAELSGIVHTAGSLLKNRDGLSAEIISQTDMSTFLQSGLVRLYGEGVTEERETSSFGDNNVFVIPAKIAKSVLTDCGIIMYDEKGNIEIIRGIDSYLVQENCCKAAFVRGIFLGGGSISGADGHGLHMEFVMNSESLAKDTVKLFGNMDIAVRLTDRRGKYVVYIKDGDTVSDILALMGAARSVIRLNEALVLRDVKNNINRGNNCFSANTDKMISAELAQVEAIQYIISRKGLEFLPEKLRPVCEYRISNSNKSYEEMSQDLGISKSTISHRMKKIVNIADNLRRGTNV